jgi:hypothetical protein
MTLTGNDGGTFNLTGMATLETLAASSGSSLIGYTQGSSGSSTRTVQAKLRNMVSLADFGPAGNGVTNDRQKFVDANAVGVTLEIDSGNYLISSSITLTAPIRFKKGAILIIPNGVTVALNGGIEAGVYQIFSLSGTGLVTFDATKQAFGYPEWWGAAPGGADCFAAMTYCIDACVTTKLQTADYFVYQTLLIDIGHRKLIGGGSQYAGAGTATRILVTSGSLHTIQVGPTAYPGSVNDLQSENLIKDVYVGRSIAPVATSACSAILNIYTIYARFENVKCAESIYPFQFQGTVQTHAVGCWAFRSSAATGGTDICYGYYGNGTSSLPLNGSNASVYLIDCNASMGGISIANSSGFFADERFTDFFIINPESSNFATGITFLGDASAVNQLTNTDVKIVNPTIDTFTFAAIYIKNCNKFGYIEVIGGYYGPANGATACIYVADSYGQVSIVAGEGQCNTATSCPGVLAINASGVDVRGFAAIEATGFGFAGSNVTNSTIDVVVKNHSNVCPAAVQMSGACSRNTFAPKVYGAAGKVSLGVQMLGATHTFSEVNCSGMDSATLGASANKLVINGVAITATGLSGNNLVSGVMA